MESDGANQRLNEMKAEIAQIKRDLRSLKSMFNPVMMQTGESADAIVEIEERLKKLEGKTKKPARKRK